jgi:hypothetical protein
MLQSDRRMKNYFTVDKFHLFVFFDNLVKMPAFFLFGFERRLRPSAQKERHSAFSEFVRR